MATKKQQAQAAKDEQPAEGTTAGNDQSSRSLIQAREDMADKQRENAERREDAGEKAADLAREAAEEPSQHGDPEKDVNEDLITSEGEGRRAASRGFDPMDPRTNAREGWFSDEDPRTLAGYDPLKDAAPGANTGKNHKPGTGQDVGKEIAGKLYENETLGSDAGRRVRHAARDGRFDVDEALKSNDPDYVASREREAGPDARNEIGAVQREREAGRQQ